MTDETWQAGHGPNNQLQACSRIPNDRLAPDRHDPRVRVVGIADQMFDRLLVRVFSPSIEEGRLKKRNR
jgi:hypothetical protein